MLFATLVLVSVDGEHDRLEQRIDLGHGHQTAEVRNVSRLRLQEEHEVAVFLGLVVVREGALLHISGIFEMARDFVLFLEGHSVLDQEGDSRVKVADILLEHEVLLGLGGDFGLELAQDLLGWRVTSSAAGVCVRTLHGMLTLCEVILNLELSVVGRHGHVQRGHGVPLRLAGGP
jgi:hypothetical protein